MKWIKLKIGVIAAIAITAGLVAWACFSGFINPVDGINFFGYPTSKEQVELSRRFRRDISEGRRDFLLRSLTPFKWDSVLFFEPYGMLSRTSPPWRFNEGYWTMAFKVAGEKDYSRLIRISRGIADFDCLAVTGNRNLVFRVLEPIRPGELRQVVIETRDGRRGAARWALSTEPTLGRRVTAARRRQNPRPVPARIQ